MLHRTLDNIFFKYRDSDVRDDIFFLYIEVEMATNQIDNKKKLQSSISK
jgi:hypothetical protein